ncbi:MAG TPA: SHOCT domain-containing protein [Thermoleophilaceae bacterium]|nr:SHOCT domain-containing protein [Thermoleophilaceae bacterium]
MVIAADYPLLDVVWTMFVFFGFVIWIWMLFSIFADIFRRHDISGWVKAGWSALIIVLPLLGVLIYLIAQGKHMAERRVGDIQQSQAQFDSHIRSVAGGGGGPASEIKQAKQLLDSGAITPDEYARLKQAALANGDSTPSYATH